MALVLYNTQAREKQRFTPLDSDNVGMYVCGPTVYDRAHIGNARPVIVFDVLYRLLKRIYGAEHVTYVRNITDIDDKINAAAIETGEPIAEITRRTTKAFHEDMAALGALPPDYEPRATEWVAQMIAMTEQLIEKGHAYEAEGHVLFQVSSMADYGALSRRSLKEMVAGARVEVAPYKKDPADFVLWKPSTPELPGWDSPWGRGRPGWHIECSAMSEHHLGKTFDIHGGGQDLIFPHHENERAQSLCLNPDDGFARYWVHNGYVIVDGKKMSKSLGNFFTVADVLDKIGWDRGEVVRLMMLSTHYRKPLDWTDAGVREARERIDRWYRALDALGDVEPVTPEPDDPAIAAFFAALEDDLNTPLAIAELHKVAREVFASLIERSGSDLGAIKGRLKLMGDFLGVLKHEPENWFKNLGGVTINVPLARMKIESYAPTIEIVPSAEWIDKKISERNAARNERNFETADCIREELEETGIVLEDGPGGTTWRRAG